MCIAIVKTAEAKIDKAVLEQCESNNSHGMGFAYPLHGKIEIVRNADRLRFDDFYARYKAEVEDQGRPALIHFRIATHGPKVEENCHPFRVNDETAFIHNGVFTGLAPFDDKEHSDTWHFNERFLKPLPRRFPWNQGMVNMIDHIAGYSNKLAFMMSSGQHLIIGESRGHWVDGVWYSNHSYKKWAYDVGGQSGFVRLGKGSGATTEADASKTTTTTKADRRRAREVASDNRKSGGIIEKKKSTEVVLAEVRHGKYGKPNAVDLPLIFDSEDNVIVPDQCEICQRFESKDLKMVELEQVLMCTDCESKYQIVDPADKDAAKLKNETCTFCTADGKCAYNCDLQH